MAAVRRGSLAKHVHVRRSLVRSVGGWAAPAPHSRAARKAEAGWASRERREAFLQELAKAHGIQEVTDWRKVSKKGICARPEGRAWLGWYKGSLQDALQDLLPELQEKAFLCASRLPGDYWKSDENKRTFLIELARRNNVRRQQDWSRVTVRQVRDLGGRGLLEECGGLEHALSQAFPSGHAFTVEPPARKRRGYWEESEHRRALVEALVERHGIREVADWKRVTYDDIVAEGGPGILAHYGNSVFAFLQDNLGIEGLTVEACRAKVPHRHWDSLENRRALLDQIAGQLGVRTAEDWATVSPLAFREAGGGTLLARYHQSMYSMLKDIYGGDDGWKGFLSRPVLPKEFWDSADNVRSFFEHARELLGVNRPAEWSRVSREEIRSVPGGGSFLHNKIRLRDALRLAYPGEIWDHHFSELGANKKASQRLVKRQVEQLFPSLPVFEDFYHDVLASDGKGKGLELDVFLPDLSLAVEFNGEHHYQELPFFAPLELTQLRDMEKRRLCAAAGIRLVTVPYWWDRSLAALAATIHQQAPGVLRSALAQ